MHYFIQNYITLGFIEMYMFMYYVILEKCAVLETQFNYLLVK